MSTLMEELTAIKAVEDKLTSNKVANFAYTDHAYNNPLTEADGVETYDVDNEQNIPVANASILKVNTTILTKGWRAQASAITRMLMNHFLGRCSYNLNKVNDLFSLLLTKLMAFLGSANGIATLDTNGVLPLTQLPKTSTPTDGSEQAFTAGGAYTLSNAIDGKAPTDHSSQTTGFGKATDLLYGHVKVGTKYFDWDDVGSIDSSGFSVSNYGLYTGSKSWGSTSDIFIRNNIGDTAIFINLSTSYIQGVSTRDFGYIDLEYTDTSPEAVSTGSNYQINVATVRGFALLVLPCSNKVRFIAN